MIVIGAARVEFGTAGWTNRTAIEIFVYRELMSAVPAQDCFFVKLPGGPNLSLVIRSFCMTFRARKPLAAAFELDCDDVEIAMPVRAAGLRI